MEPQPEPQPERNTYHIRGAAAEVRWGFRLAATLGPWTVDGLPGAWTFSAVVLEHDDFRVSQRPLTVVTPNGWRWPVTTLQIAGTTLTASVSPQESCDVLPVCST